MNCCKSKPKQTTTTTSTVPKAPVLQTNANYAPPVAPIQPLTSGAVPQVNSSSYGGYGGYGTTSNIGVSPYASNIGGQNINTAASVIGSKIPKSTISFAAQDYDSAPLNNQNAFISTKRVTHYVQDRGDRPEDYAYQINQANQSKLLMPNNILNYDLDREDGVSKTPVINTFHYQSILNHLFLHNYAAGDNINRGTALNQSGVMGNPTYATTYTTNNYTTNPIPMNSSQIANDINYRATNTSGIAYNPNTSGIAYNANTSGIGYNTTTSNVQPVSVSGISTPAVNVAPTSMAVSPTGVTVNAPTATYGTYGTTGSNVYGSNIVNDANRTSNISGTGVVY